MIKISVLSVEKSTPPGKKYQVLEVSFKNLTFGKVESKKLFSFGAQAQAFNTLAGAVTGEVFEVDMVKNDAGYNDWTKVAQQAPGTQPQSPTEGKPNTATAVAKGTWETPEERAKKQVYIIKQSSLAQAVATLSVGSKGIKKEDVVELAQFYTDFVFNDAAPKQALFDTPNDLEEDDIPY